MAGSELYWVPRVAWEHLVATEDHNWPEAQRCYKRVWAELALGFAGVRRVLRFLSGLGAGAGPLDGLLIPGALLSLCILLCLNRINLILELAAGLLGYSSACLLPH